MEKEKERIKLEEEAQATMSRHQACPYMQQPPCMMQGMYMNPSMMCPQQMQMQQPMGCPGMMGQQSMQQPMMGQMDQSMGYSTGRDDEEDEDFADGDYRYSRPYYPHHSYYPFYPYYPYYPYHHGHYYHHHR